MITQYKKIYEYYLNKLYTPDEVALIYNDFYKYITLLFTKFTSVKEAEDFFKTAWANLKIREEKGFLPDYLFNIFENIKLQMKIPKPHVKKDLQELNTLTKNTTYYENKLPTDKVASLQDSNEVNTLTQQLLDKWSKDKI
jgi:hypothetical protein